MLTYESASEAEVLKSLWIPGAPLENTVFAILDPTGRAIVRGGRGPNHVFRDSFDMATRMDEIARYYNSNSRVTPSALPSVDTVRLALNVAACEKRPLAIVVGRNEQERQMLASKLASIAWSDQLIGKLVYTTGRESDLNSIRGARLSAGYVFAGPNVFGTEASAMIQLGPFATQYDLMQASARAASYFRPEYLSHHDHVRLGHQQGVYWQTAIPETDPHSIRARQMGAFGYR